MPLEKERVNTQTFEASFQTICEKLLGREEWSAMTSIEAWQMTNIDPSIHNAFRKIPSSSLLGRAQAVLA